MSQPSTKPRRTPAHSDCHALEHTIAASGLTVVEAARRFRVSADKIRHWIACGELRAVNTASALCGRPRWVVLPEALAEFKRRRAGGLPPKPMRRKRRRQDAFDYYPDEGEDGR